MDKLAQENDLDLASSKDIAALQRLPGINLDARLRLKSISSKWVRGMEAAEAHYGKAESCS